MEFYSQNLLTLRISPPHRLDDLGKLEIILCWTFPPPPLGCITRDAKLFSPKLFSVELFLFLMTSPSNLSIEPNNFLQIRKLSMK